MIAIEVEVSLPGRIEEEAGFASRGGVHAGSPLPSYPEGPSPTLAGMAERETPRAAATSGAISAVQRVTEPSRAEGVDVVC